MFRKAILKLTAKYSLVILGIVWVFSFGIYSYMDRSFSGFYLNQYHQSGAQNGHQDLRAEGAAEATDAGLSNLRNILLTVNGILLLAVPAASFVLAKTTLKPLKESYDAQQRFVDDASHELRTPLAIIIGELELALQKKRQSKDYRQTIKSGLEETHKMNQLVNNLLALASEGQAGSINMEELELKKLIRGVLAQLEKPAKVKKISFETDFPGSAFRLFGNKLMIEQLARNIIDNAIKFSPDGSTVRIALIPKSKTFVIEVKDQGIGMPAQDARRAFDRFWRSDSARGSRGHGLGLSIARQIVTVHGGSIRLKPQPSQGMTVIIELPKFTKKS